MTNDQEPRTYRPPWPTGRMWPDAGSWIRRALCRQVEPELFYANHNKGRGERDSNAVAAARAICSRCPVAAECLDYALACEDLDPYGGHGVWAGLTGQERNLLRRRLKETA